MNGKIIDDLNALVLDDGMVDPTLSPEGVPDAPCTLSLGTEAEYKQLFAEQNERTLTLGQCNETTEDIVKLMENESKQLDEVAAYIMVQAIKNAQIPVAARYGHTSAGPYMLIQWQGYGIFLFAGRRYYWRGNGALPAVSGAVMACYWERVFDGCGPEEGDPLFVSDFIDALMNCCETVADADTIGDAIGYTAGKTSEWFRDRFVRLDLTVRLIREIVNFHSNKCSWLSGREFRKIAEEAASRVLITPSLPLPPALPDPPF